MIKRKTIIVRIFLLTAVLSGFSFFLPAPLSAAPFCIESNGVTPACWYYDAKECKTKAQKEHARCSVNLKEIRILGKGGSHCIIDSDMRPLCAFQNWESCEEAASRKSSSICFQNNTKQSNDPYRFDRMPLQPK